jgi:hypothetical protein
MLDRGARRDLWPATKAAVLSIDFARQQDVIASLSGSEWNLVIVDEAHKLGGTSSTFVRRLRDSTSHMVIASHLRPESGIAGDDATLIEWQTDQLLDREGRPLVSRDRPVLHQIPVVYSDEERSFIDSALKFASMLMGSKYRALVAGRVQRALASSPSALELSLRRLLSSEPSESRVPQNTPDRMSTSSGRHILLEDSERQASEQLLERLDSIRHDSKLEAFSQLLDQLITNHDGRRCVCVTAEYASTLFYLAAALDFRGVPYEMLHGAAGGEEQDRALIQFEKQGGVLLTTQAVLQEGVNLPFVSDLIFYDIPSEERRIEIILARVNRMGRLNDAEIHVVLDEFSSDSPSLKSLLKRCRIIQK